MKPHSPRRILLVEDSPRDTELVMEVLQESNITNEVTAMSDGAEALDYLFRRGNYAGNTDERPAVILLDLKMPKVDGLEVLRIIKSDPELHTIPVVILSSSREEQDLLKSYELGVNAYVVKPLTFSQFVHAVKQVGIFWTMINEVCPQKED